MKKFALLALVLVLAFGRVFFYGGAKAETQITYEYTDIHGRHVVVEDPIIEDDGSASDSIRIATETGTAVIYMWMADCNDEEPSGYISIIHEESGAELAREYYVNGDQFAMTLEYLVMTWFGSLEEA